MEHPIPLCMSAEGRPELRGPEREMSDACLVLFGNRPA
jgi:hypothetical protein